MAHWQGSNMLFCTLSHAVVVVHWLNRLDLHSANNKWSHFLGSVDDYAIAFAFKHRHCVSNNYIQPCPMVNEIAYYKNIIAHFFTFSGKKIDIDINDGHIHVFES